MSFSSSSKKSYQDESISKEQQEYIRQLQAQKAFLEEQKILKYKSMLQKTYETKETAANINVNLSGQTQKLQNIHAIANDTGKLIEKANQTSKQMSSFWYMLGKKIKKVFVGEKSDQLEGKYDKTKNGLSDETKSDDTGQQFTKVSSPNKIQSKTQTKQEDVDDIYLDQLTNGIRELKGMAKQTNKNLTKQTDLINKIDKKMDFNSNKMQEANKRLKKNFL